MHLHNQKYIPPAAHKLFKKFSRSYKKWKKTGDIDYYTMYKSLKKKYRSKIRTRRAVYEESILKSQNKQNFFKYIKSKLNSKHSEIIKLIDSSGVIVSDPGEIASMFNKYFSSVYGPETLVDIDDRSLSPGSSIKISTDIVSKALKSNGSQYALGIDGIPFIFWKSNIHVLIFTLTKMFQKFLDTGYIPACWKQGIIKPIFKGKGSKCDANNFRPITLTCSLSRIFEKVILDLIKPNLCNFLNYAQHGYCSKRSTLSNLLDFYNIVTTKIDNGETVAITYFDLSKAFDKLDHQILIDRLNFYKLPPVVVRIIRSFLKGRTQCVSVLGSVSFYTQVTSGVPQGSVLGPTLFIIYINELFSHTFSGYLSSYVDDLKLLSLKGSEQQQDVARLVSWLENNKLPVNSKKCSVMYVQSKRPFDDEGVVCKIDTYELPKLGSVMDLGILVDANLSFHLQVQRTRIRSYRLINLSFLIFSF